MSFPVDKYYYDFTQFKFLLFKRYCHFIQLNAYLFIYFVIHSMHNAQCNSIQFNFMLFKPPLTACLPAGPGQTSKAIFCGQWCNLIHFFVLCLFFFLFILFYYYFAFLFKIFSFFFFISIPCGCHTACESFIMQLNRKSTLTVILVFFLYFMGMQWISSDFKNYD